MGAFFTNVLVRTTSGELAALDAVAVAVDRALKADGWNSLSGAPDGPTRRVLLVPVDGWVAVYDEGTEAQDTEVLARLASDLSSFTGATVVSTLVHDSDYLVMQLFGGGDSVGFVERDVDGAHINEGGFGPWRQAFPDLKRAVAADALKREHTFVEDNLRELATAIGLPVDAVSTGFKYSLDESASRPGVRTLSYAPSAIEQPTEPNVALVNAEDLAAEQAGVVEWDATFRNHGSAFRGLSITLHQPEGLLSLEWVRVTVGGPFSPGEPIVEERTFDAPRSLVEPLILDFASVALPAGASLAHLRKLKVIGFEEWARVAMPTLITVDVRFVPAASGAGRLMLAAAPLSQIAPEHHDVACVVA
jgi:hypothetical protein